MASENFDEIMKHIFASEGGYVDHPRDPGGATNMGITIGTLRAYRGRSVTKSDVKKLTKAEAAEIYRKNYWNVVKGDELPGGVDFCAMDSAVHSGPSRAAKWLQKAVGATADGAIGPLTVRAAQAANAETTVKRMCDVRMSFLRGLSTWSSFGKGWTRRMDGVRSVALKMASGAPSVTAPVAPPIVDDPMPVPEDPEPVREHWLVRLLRTLFVRGAA